MPGDHPALSVEEQVHVHVEGSRRECRIRQVVFGSGGQATQNGTGSPPGRHRIEQPQRIQPAAVPDGGGAGHGIGIPRGGRVPDGLEGRSGRGCGCVGPQPVPQRFASGSHALTVTVQEPACDAGQIPVELKTPGPFPQATDSRQPRAGDLLRVVGQSQPGLPRYPGASPEELSQANRGIFQVSFREGHGAHAQRHNASRPAVSGTLCQRGAAAGQQEGASRGAVIDGSPHDVPGTRSELPFVDEHGRGDSRDALGIRHEDLPVPVAVQGHDAAGTSSTGLGLAHPFRAVQSDGGQLRQQLIQLLVNHPFRVFHRSNATDSQVQTLQIRRSDAERGGPDRDRPSPRRVSVS